MDKFKFKLFKTRVKDILLTDFAQVASQSKQPVSAIISNQIKNKIAELTTNDELQNTVTTAVQEALVKWRSQPEGNNSLIVLANPVSPLTRILNDSLGEDSDNPLEVNSLSWQARVHNFEQIKNELLSTVKPKSEIATNKPLEPSNLENRRVLIIPRLEWCFLRCIGGLEAIETIKDLIAGDSETFWLIGCNSWAWQYLDKVYQISAYLQHSVSFPALNGTQMQKWLQPIHEEINPVWGEDREWLQIKKKELKQAKKQHLELDEVLKQKERYYNNLADIAQGVATIAGDLWWRSLLVSESDTNVITYQIEKAKLPDLPDLVVADRYLLYSLLMHGGMSLPQLASTMSKNQSILKARTQYLLQAGVIDKEQSILTVNPAYYPRLKTILSNNNFLVD
ncbi:MAG: hypothetical protein AAGE84_24735 [Cyanobacteria bacterium P01_G01_bin.39]